MYTIHKWSGRNRKTLNEIRVFDDHCELDMYNNAQEVIATILLDTDDLDKVKDVKWTWCHGDYACHMKTRTFMHRLILDAVPGTQVDHINGKGFDNRKCNLRIATQSQQSCNMHCTRSNTGIKGVSYIATHKKYHAEIKHNGLRKAKKFDCLTDAEAWVKCVRNSLHGEFANHGDNSQPVSQPQTTPELSQ